MGTATKALRKHLLLHALVISVALNPLEANAFFHRSHCSLAPSLPPKRSTSHHATISKKDARSSGALNPVALGIRSAILHGTPPLFLLEPGPAHAAFSGSKALPPPRWHERLFGGGRDGGDGHHCEGRPDRGTVEEARDAAREKERVVGGSKTRMSSVKRTRLFGASSSVAETSATSAQTPTAATTTGTRAAARPLTFWESMACGAASRSVAQTATHPANVIKTLKQTSRSSSATAAMASSISSSSFSTTAVLSRPMSNVRLLTRGAWAQFVLSIPQGAVNFAVLEYIRKSARDGLRRTGRFGENLEQNGAVSAGLDFLSSAASTLCCSVVSSPVGVLTDNIMAGNYPDLPRAVSGIASRGGVRAFYTGWWPSMCGKIPSYGLTWACFQRLKEVHGRLFDGKTPTDLENSLMGCVASGVVVCVMMPMDTMKTRIVTQRLGSNLVVPYNGMLDCATRMFKEEGLSSFYRGLTPRLMSVVPNVGIQFGVYEGMKRLCLERYAVTKEEDVTKHVGRKGSKQSRGREH